MSIAKNAKTGGPMRIFIFKSETSPKLRAFGCDLAGISCGACARKVKATETVIGAIAQPIL